MMVAILEIKLGRPYQMPARRMEKLLEQARRDCCKARNAAITHWLLWRRQHPDWEPGGEYDPPPRKIRRTEKPPKPDAKPPKDPPYGPREFLSRELYAVASGAARTLNTSLASSCVQDVVSRLKSKTPYNHDGNARWVWRAILDSEVSLPTWRGGKIPAPRSVVTLHYSEDECWVRFPLLSKRAGYRTLSPQVRLHVSDLTAGNRRLLRKIVSGEIRLADSQLYEKKGRWYFQACYELPTPEELQSERVLTLEIGKPDSDYPFRLRWTDSDGKDRDWTAGKAKPLIAEYRRIQARRRAIRWRYRDGAGSGHGRQRWAKAIKPMERAVRDLCSRWQKQFVADVIKHAIKEGCGAILYREPTMPLREKTLFASQDVPFDWTSFLGRLRFKAEAKGVRFNVTRMGMKEWQGEEGEEPETPAPVN